MNRCIVLGGLGIATLLSTSCWPTTQTSAGTVVTTRQIAIGGTYKHNSPVGQWSRGMPTTMYCGNRPESWVRGDARLDPGSGILRMTVQLETDDVFRGPTGRVSAALKDVNGNTLATAFSDEIGTGGKGSGQLALRNFSSQVRIDPGVADQVSSILLDAQCTGSSDRLWNVRPGTPTDAFRIGVTSGAM
jgi:hypothetical protein